MDYAKYQKDVWQGATSFAWKTFRDPHIRRQFRMLAVLGRAALEEDKLTEVDHLFFFLLLQFSLKMIIICQLVHSTLQREICTVPTH